MSFIKGIIEKDRDNFRKLYELYSDKVYNTAISYAQNVSDAEEITQDVFANIYRNASKFRGDSALGTWIYRITVNTSLNYVKKKNRLSFKKTVEHDKDYPDFEHPGIVLENKENAALLFKVIDTLPASQKTAFILSYIEDLPRKEVADVMEISLKAVESLLQRGKKNLREKLEKHYPQRRK
jgi:RNA polymerase sigma-70 factor (ECF subfamily)